MLSVLQQSFQDFELVVVDDCSSDDTADVVKSIKQHNVKYIRNQINKGESGSRNTGIKSTDSKYIAFLDDDDEWLSDKLEKQILSIEKKSGDHGAIYTGFYFSDANTGEIIGGELPSKSGHIYNDLLYYNFITGGGSTMLVKRECFEKVGLFDTEFQSAGDWDMWIRIAREYKYTYVKEKLAIYKQHSSNVSKNVKAFIQGEERMIAKYRDDLKHLHKAYSHHCHKLGILYSLNDETKKGRELFLKAIWLYPYNVKPFFYLMLSLGRSGGLTRKYVYANKTVRELARTYMNR